VVEEQFISYKDHKYYLKQFHFHNASEHTINKIYYPVECHLVHEAIINGISQIIVIGIMVNLGSNSLINFNGLFDSDSYVFNLSFLDDLKKFPSYFYVGTLTTPPFTPNITWFVFDNPQLMSMSSSDYVQFLQSYNNNRAIEQSPYIDNRNASSSKNNIFRIKRYY
jgi:carbonic anhydrase